MQLTALRAGTAGRGSVAPILRGLLPRRASMSRASGDSGHPAATSPRATLGAGRDSAGLLKQHKLLMRAGFTHDVASLILQLSEQRCNAGVPPSSATPAAEATPAAGTCAEGPASPQPAAAAPATDAEAAAGGVRGGGLQGLEQRISFLELELLKQSLTAASPTATPPDSAAGSSLQAAAAATAGSPRAGSSWRRAARSGSPFINGGGSGAGYLDAAAAAAAAQWGADGLLRRQQQQQQQQQQRMWAGAFPDLPDSSSRGLFTGAGGGAVGDDLLAVLEQLQQGPLASTLPPPADVADAAASAASEQLGELDPEVRALAEALAVRQGRGSLLEQLTLQQQAQQELQQHAAALLAVQQQAQQGWARRPASVWGSSSAWRAQPLAARAWGAGAGQRADSLCGSPGVPGGGLPQQQQLQRGWGEPLLSGSDLQEDVPYEPSGWAVAGTVACVYLGVIATFLLLCVGDVPY